MSFLHIFSLPGMVIVCVAPCRSLKTGETAVVGEELILPLSGLGERFPLTRTSQLALPPPWTSVIQSPPVYLDRNDSKQMHILLCVVYMLSPSGRQA